MALRGDMFSKLFKSTQNDRSPGGSDSTPESDVIQQIGREAVLASHDPRGKVLLYAEAEDGVISADIFSQTGDEPVRFRFAPSALKNLIYAHREAAQDHWATMSYVIENDRFRVSFEHPENLVKGEDLADRRPRVLRMHFGDAPVDYSAPR